MYFSGMELISCKEYAPPDGTCDCLDECRSNSDPCHWVVYYGNEYPLSEKQLSELKSIGVIITGSSNTHVGISSVELFKNPIIGRVFIPRESTNESLINCSGYNGDIMEDPLHRRLRELSKQVRLIMDEICIDETMDWVVNVWGT
jgi:hypothetical protein